MCSTVITSTLPVAVTKMSARGAAVFHGHDLIAFHRGLQRADGIDLRHHHAAAGLAQRSGRALAHIAEAADHRDLAGHHHVGAAADAVHQGFAAAIEIVELRLGDAVVHIDGGEQQLALLFHLIEAMHAGGGFLRHALDAGGELGEPARLFLQGALDQGVEDFLFLVGRPCPGKRCRLFRRAGPHAPAWWRRRRRPGSCWAVPPSPHSRILRV